MKNLRYWPLIIAAIGIIMHGCGQAEEEPRDDAPVYDDDSHMSGFASLVDLIDESGNHLPVIDTTLIIPRNNNSITFTLCSEYQLPSYEGTGNDSGFHIRLLDNISEMRSDHMEKTDPKVGPSGIYYRRYYHQRVTVTCDTTATDCPLRYDYWIHGGTVNYCVVRIVKNPD